jgi:spore coat protein CotH
LGDASADPGIVVPEPADDAAYLFDQKALRTYNLIVAEADLAIINANPAAEQWVTGMLEFEGKKYGPLGVRYKGSVGAFLAPCMGGTIGAPLGPKQGKCSVKVGFDHVDENARFFGLRKLNFHSMNNDPSMMRDRLGYGLFRDMGLAASRVVHARLLFNGQLEGLFALVEQVDGRFARSRFTEGGEGNVYKEIWPLHDDAAAYTNALESNQGPTTSVAGMLHFKQATLAGPAALLDWLDKAYMLRYIAVDRVIINDDGAFHWWCAKGGQGNNPNGVGNHNYYWYEAAASSRFWLIPWDLDSSFDSSPFVHIAPQWTGEGSCTCTSPAGQLAPSCDRMIKSWGTWRPDYEAAVDAFLQGPFAPNNVDAKLDAWISQIQSSVAETAGLNGAPTDVTWRAAESALRGKIATARASRGFPY